MYCSHCGKKVTDTMLFCPFCGEPIVIPDQDAEQEAQTPESAPTDGPLSGSLDDWLQSLGLSEEGEEQSDSTQERGKGADAAEELLSWERARSREPDLPAADQQPVFTPLRLEQDDGANGNWREEIIRKKQSVVQEKKAPEITAVEDQPVRLEGSAPKLNGAPESAKSQQTRRPESHRGPVNTLVPPKPMDPDDLFMDRRDADASDPYDAFDVDMTEEESIEYEEELQGGFFARHMRGLVGAILFLALVMMFIIFALTHPGQRLLASVNLCWNAEIYAELGYENVLAGNYNQAGIYYERALNRQPQSYNYAQAAAQSYEDADNREKATEMLVRCIEINPSQLDPYLHLLILYPDAAERPFEITRLIRQGYQMTGDNRLNIPG